MDHRRRGTRSAPAHGRRRNKLGRDGENAARDAMSQARSHFWSLSPRRQTWMDSGDVFAEGEWRAGWVALRFCKEPDTALRHFRDSYRARPRSSPRHAGLLGRPRRGARKDTAARRTWYKLRLGQTAPSIRQLAAIAAGRARPLRIKPNPTDAPGGPPPLTRMAGARDPRPERDRGSSGARGP